MSFQPKYNFIEELKWRHLFHQATPKTEERLNTKKTKIGGFALKTLKKL